MTGPEFTAGEIPVWPLLTPDGPRVVGVAGDWHGNTFWATSAIRQITARLDSQPQKIILHAGDFGIWPGDTGYLNAVNTALVGAGAHLMFVDGNHEDHGQLAVLAARYEQGHCSPPYMVRSRIWWLPRGYRWTWHGLTWLALGGAVSPDKTDRAEGVDWWPGEAITPGQALLAAAGGPADVMFTHDCPAAVIHSFPDRPSWWDPADIAACETHARLLQTVVDAVQPKHLIHGHLHRGYRRPTEMGHGTVMVTGLDCDGKQHNWMLLDTATMQPA